METLEAITGLLLPNYTPFRSFTHGQQSLEPAAKSPCAQIFDWAAHFGFDRPV
jgi:hypothetical protein